jgi:TetR/AcrR family transcriptional regulator, regulator of cefoperazone and chloramphenicol sensitivity
VEINPNGKETMAQKTATKKHILEATIGAIEKYGLQNLTTRMIAEEAGVNNAALHYYYGTKEQLVSEALKMTLDHMMEDTEAILAGDGGIAGRLTELFEYMGSGVVHFPNIIRAHLSGPLMEGTTDSPFIRMMGTWMDRTVAELEASLGDEHRARLRVVLHGALSSMLVTGLMPDPGYNFSPVDLRDDLARRKFIEYIIQTITQVGIGITP